VCGELLILGKSVIRHTQDREAHPRRHRPQGRRRRGLPERQGKHAAPRLAHDQALAKVMQHLLKDDTEVYKQFVQNESFKRFVTDMVYQLTTTPEGFNKEGGPQRSSPENCASTNLCCEYPTK
jgi:hypothetical protein